MCQKNIPQCHKYVENCLKNLKKITKILFFFSKSDHYINIKAWTHEKHIHFTYQQTPLLQKLKNIPKEKWYWSLWNAHLCHNVWKGENFIIKNEIKYIARGHSEKFIPVPFCKLRFLSHFYQTFTWHNIMKWASFYSKIVASFMQHARRIYHTPEKAVESSSMVTARCDVWTKMDNITWKRHQHHGKAVTLKCWCGIKYIWLDFKFFFSVFQAIFLLYNA